MKIVGLMLVRNEDWIVGMTLRAALKWCDAVVVLDHCSTDGTSQILEEVYQDNPDQISRLECSATESLHWNEMQLRQRLLDEGRRIGGTHFAIIDGDEMMTANLLPVVRAELEKLKAGHGVSFRMVAPYNSLNFRRTDGYWGATSGLFLGFRDAPFLEWRPAGDGYQFHARPPYGTATPVTIARPEMTAGGVFHFQFVTLRRLQAKAAWYKMVETLRWPGRMPPAQLNRKYDWTLDESQCAVSPLPDSWWAAYVPLRQYFDPLAEPWHTVECRRMADQVGLAPFKGLNLHGIV